MPTFLFPLVQDEYSAAALSSLYKSQHGPTNPGVYAMQLYLEPSGQQVAKQFRLLLVLELLTGLLDLGPTLFGDRNGPSSVILSGGPLGSNSSHSGMLCSVISTISCCNVRPESMLLESMMALDSGKFQLDKDDRLYLIASILTTAG